jgi:hypothetical protein
MTKQPVINERRSPLSVGTLRHQAVQIAPIRQMTKRTVFTAISSTELSGLTAVSGGISGGWGANRLRLKRPSAAVYYLWFQEAFAY